VGDTFILGHLLEGTQISPARPSCGTSMKMKMFEEDARRLTVVSCNKCREIVIYFFVKEHNLEIN